MITFAMLALNEYEGNLLKELCNWLFTFRDSAGLEVLFTRRDGGSAFTREYIKVPLILKNCLLIIGHLEFPTPVEQQVKRCQGWLTWLHRDLGLLLHKKK